MLRTSYERRVFLRRGLLRIGIGSSGNEPDCELYRDAGSKYLPIFMRERNLEWKRVRGKLSVRSFLLWKFCRIFYGRIVYFRSGRNRNVPIGGVWFEMRKHGRLPRLIGRIRVRRDDAHRRRYVLRKRLKRRYERMSVRLWRMIARRRGYRHTGGLRESRESDNRMMRRRLSRMIFVRRLSRMRIDGWEGTWRRRWKRMNPNGMRSRLTILKQSRNPGYVRDVQLGLRKLLRRRRLILRWSRRFLKRQ